MAKRKSKAKDKTAQAPEEKVVAADAKVDAPEAPESPVAESSEPSEPLVQLATPEDMNRELASTKSWGLSEEPEPRYAPSITAPEKGIQWVTKTPEELGECSIKLACIGGQGEHTINVPVEGNIQCEVKFERKGNDIPWCLLPPKVANILRSQNSARSKFAEI